MKNALRQHLLQSCSEQELARWFDPLSLVVEKEAALVLVSFPHQFFADWFEGSMRSRFEARLHEFLGDGFAVRYGLVGAAPGPEAGTKNETRRLDHPYGPAFTFETFLVGKKNYFPLASAKEVAKQAGNVFNPFVVCGGSGSGKTHLLRAMANDIAHKSGAGSIFLASADELGDLLSGRFSGDRIALRNHLVQHDFLFVDDFHALRHAPEMQKTFITVFDQFHAARKQMVFGFLGKPGASDSLDPMLRSRLEWGLIVTLKEPDLEVRVSFIQDKIRSRKLPLGKDQILVLAQRFQDFRNLQGVLLKLFAFRELVKKDLDERDFDQILEHTEERNAESLTPNAIIGVVAEHMGVNPKEITGAKRHQNIAQARQVAMFLCRSLLGLSFPALGRAFGGKDHSTVLYSVKKVERNQSDDQVLKKLLQELKKKCLLSGAQGIPG